MKEKEEININKEELKTIKDSRGVCLKVVEVEVKNKGEMDDIKWIGW